MTLDQRITHAAARVAVAWANMDEQQAVEWQAEVDRLMDARDERDAAARYADRIGMNLPRAERLARARAARLDHCATFAALKGSPNHSALGHA